MSWYTQGTTQGQQEAEEDDIRRAQPDRVFLGPGKSLDGMIVDDDTFNYHEHQYAILRDGKKDWRNWLTCTRAGCDGCGILGFEGRKTYAVTFIDTQGYVSTKDKTVKGKGEIKLLAMNYAAFQKFTRMKERNTSLAGKKVHLVRDTEDEPPSGIVESVLKEYTAEELAALFPYITFRGKKLVDLWAKAATDEHLLRKLDHVFQLPKDPETQKVILAPRIPVFNYARLLEPRTPMEMQRLLSRAIHKNGGAKAASSGGGEGSGGSQEEGNVPF